MMVWPSETCDSSNSFARPTRKTRHTRPSRPTRIQNYLWTSIKNLRGSELNTSESWECLQNISPDQILDHLMVIAILKKGLEQSTLWVTPIPKEHLTLLLPFIALQSSGPSWRSTATQERLWTSTLQQGCTQTSWRRSMKTTLEMISECALFRYLLIVTSNSNGT